MASKPMCTFFLKGECFNGDQCPFLHSPEDTRRQCHFYSTGRCRFGSSCMFLHLDNHEIACAMKKQCVDYYCNFSHPEGRIPLCVETCLDEEDCNKLHPIQSVSRLQCELSNSLNMDYFDIFTTAIAARHAKELERLMEYRDTSFSYLMRLTKFQDTSFTNLIRSFDESILNIQYTPGVQMDRSFAITISRNAGRLVEGLPVYGQKSKISHLVSSNSCVFLQSDTNANTSHIIQYLAEMITIGNLPGRKIIVSQNNRPAVASLAQKLSKEIGFTKLKQGRKGCYHIDTLEGSSRNVIIEIMTEKALLSSIIANKSFLNDVAVAVLDDAQERSKTFDILLCIMKTGPQIGKWPNLRVVVSTNDSYFFDNETSLSLYLFDVPKLQISHLSEIEVLYQPLKRNEDHVFEAVKLASKIHKQTLPYTGGILVFLASADEVNRAMKMFKKIVAGNQSHRCLVLPYYGQHDFGKNDLAFASTPEKTRKIIFSIGSHVFIEGIRHVIDCGLEKYFEYDYGRKLPVFQIRRITKNTAARRRDCAGITSTGVCYRLYSQDDYVDMLEAPKPEILKTPVESTLVSLRTLGYDTRLPNLWIDQPDHNSIENSYKELISANIIDKNGVISILGNLMALLQVDVEVARLLYYGCMMGMGESVAYLAGILAAGNTIFANSINEADDKSRRHARKSLHIPNEGDVVMLFRLFETFRGILHNTINVNFEDTNDECASDEEDDVSVSDSMDGSDVDVSDVDDEEDDDGGDEDVDGDGDNDNNSNKNNKHHNIPIDGTTNTVNLKVKGSSEVRYENSNEMHFAGGVYFNPENVAKAAKWCKIHNISSRNIVAALESSWEILSTLQNCTKIWNACPNQCRQLRNIDIRFIVAKSYFKNIATRNLSLSSCQYDILKADRISRAALHSSSTLWKDVHGSGVQLPEWIVFLNTFQAGKAILTLCTPVEYSWITSDDPIFADVIRRRIENKSVDVVMDISMAVKESLLGRYYVNKAMVERELAASITIDEERGYIIATCEQSRSELVRSSLAKMLQDSRASIVQNICEDYTENRKIRALFGAGGMVTELLFEGEFVQVNLTHINPRLTEYEIKSLITSQVGPIRTAVVTSDLTGCLNATITFYAKDDAQKLVSMVQEKKLPIPSSLHTTQVKASPGGLIANTSLENTSNFAGSYHTIVNLTYFLERLTGNFEVKFKSIDVANSAITAMRSRGWSVYLVDNAGATVTTEIPLDKQLYSNSPISSVLSTSLTVQVRGIRLNVYKIQFVCQLFGWAEVSRQLWRAETATMSSYEQKLVKIVEQFPPKYRCSSALVRLNLKSVKFRLTFGSTISNISTIRNAFLHKFEASNNWKYCTNSSDNWKYCIKYYSVQCLPKALFYSDTVPRSYGLYYDVAYRVKTLATKYGQPEYVKVITTSSSDSGLRSWAMSLEKSMVLSPHFMGKLHLLRTPMGKEMLSSIDSYFEVDVASNTVRLLKTSTNKASILAQISNSINTIEKELSNMSVKSFLVTGGHRKTLFKNQQNIMTKYKLQQFRFEGRKLSVTGKQSDIDRFASDFAHSIADHTTSQKNCSDGQLCMVCMDEIEEGYELTNCGHKSCLNCLAGQFLEAERQVDVCLPVKCFHPGCQQPEYSWFDVELIASASAISFLKKASLERFVFSNRDKYRKCVLPTCSGILRISNISIDSNDESIQGGLSYQCAVCERAFCIRCSDRENCPVTRHKGQSCETVAKRQDKSVSHYLNHITADLLNVHCPRCQSAFLDFDGCFALKCGNSACCAGFCGFCLADCGSDAHSHISTLKCSRNPSPGNYFNSFAVFNNIHRLGKKEKIKKYLRQIPDYELMKTVLSCAKSYMCEVGIEIELHEVNYDTSKSKATEASKAKQLEEDIVMDAKKAKKAIKVEAARQAKAAKRAVAIQQDEAARQARILLQAAVRIDSTKNKPAEEEWVVWRNRKRNGEKI